MRLRDRARPAYASALEQQGSAWSNAAGSVRAGFENVWITPALDAIAEVLRFVPDDEDGGA